MFRLNELEQFRARSPEPLSANDGTTAPTLSFPRVLQFNLPGDIAPCLRCKILSRIRISYHRLAACFHFDLFFRELIFFFKNPVGPARNLSFSFLPVRVIRHPSHPLRTSCRDLQQISCRRILVADNFSARFGGCLDECQGRTCAPVKLLDLLRTAAGN